jgi:hypothetical protein
MVSTFIIFIYLFYDVFNLIFTCFHWITIAQLIIFLHLSMCHMGHIFLYNFWLTLPLPCEHGKCLSFTFTQIQKYLNPRYLSLSSSIFLKFYIFTYPINTLNSYTTHYPKDILNQYTKLGIVDIWVWVY